MYKDGYTMQVKVVKFGGSSLADAEHFRQVAAIIKADPARRYVVPSAPGKRFKDDIKVTDLFYACYDKVRKHESIDEIYDKIKERYNGIISELGLNFDNDSINRIRVFMDKKEANFHCRSIPLSKSDLKILRFFLYNYTKVFRYDEIFEYLHYTGRIKDKTFDGYVQRINRVTIEHHREKMIYKRKLGYEMPVLLGKNPHLFDQRYNIFAT